MPHKKTIMCFYKYNELLLINLHKHENKFILLILFLLRNLILSSHFMWGKEMTSKQAATGKIFKWKWGHVRTVQTYRNLLNVLHWSCCTITTDAYNDLECLGLRSAFSIIQNIKCSCFHVNCKLLPARFSKFGSSQCSHTCQNPWGAGSALEKKMLNCSLLCSWSPSPTPSKSRVCIHCQASLCQHLTLHLAALGTSTRYEFVE